MALYVVRLWLPDRPGALGQVASRIGAVRGDVVGIDILERGGGRVIDELAVSLPDDELVELLIAEIAQVDGVDVEDVRAVVGLPDDAQLNALAVVERIVQATDAAALLDGLCLDVQDDLDADWVTVVGLDPALTIAAAGDAPAAAWLAAFLDGTSHLDSSDHEHSAPADLAWAALPVAASVLVVGRRQRAFRSRERRQLAFLARVADALAARMDGPAGGAVATPHTPAGSALGLAGPAA